MPTTRRRVKRAQDAIRITPEMIDAFVAGDIERLDQLLGKIPYSDPSPIEATTDDPPPGCMEIPGLVWRKNWPAARQLHIRLKEAAHADHPQA